MKKTDFRGETIRMPSGLGLAALLALAGAPAYAQKVVPNLSTS